MGLIDRMVETSQTDGLVQRHVIIHREDSGYGFTVSGDNPVYVQSVKENCAAERSGVRVGDQIIKVNGTVVTKSNHLEVVRLIKSGSFVALLLQGRASVEKEQADSAASITSAHARSNSLGSVNSLIQSTDPKVADYAAELRRTLHHEREFHQKILKEYMQAPSAKSQKELAESQTRINALEHQIKALTGSLPAKSQSASSATSGFRQSPGSSPPPRLNKGFVAARPQPPYPPRSAGLPSSAGISYSFQPREGVAEESTPKDDLAYAPSNQPLLKSSPVISPYPSSVGLLNRPAKMDVDIGSVTSTSSLKRHNSEPNNQFDDMFQKAQIENLTSHVPLHSAVSVISMEDDEFDVSGENFTDHGPFVDLRLLQERPAHLSVFLHFLMSNSDPSALLFLLVTETFEREQGSVKDLKKWAYEIFSTFVAQSSPLKVAIPKAEELGIEEALDNPRATEERIRTVFEVSRRNVFSEVNEQLADFRNKRALGLGGLFGDHQLEDNLDKAKELKVVEQTLLPHLDALMVDADSAVESPQNDRNLAMAAALATFMKQIGVCSKSAGGHSSPLDRCRSFAEKSKNSIFTKIKTGRRTFQINNHQFAEMQYTSLTLCNHCRGLLWGIGAQGLQCSLCECNVHRGSCMELLSEVCPGPKGRKKYQKPVIPVKVPEGHQDDEDSVKDVNSELPRTTRSSVDEFEKFAVIESVNAGSNLEDPPQPQVSSEADKTDKVDPSSRSATPSEEAPVKEKTKPNPIRIKAIPSVKVVNRADVKNFWVGDRRKEKPVISSKPMLPGIRTKSDSPENGVYGPTPYHGPKVDSPPLSEEEEEWDSDLDVETEVPNWQVVADKKVLKKLKNKEIKRQEVIHELIHTEKTHVRNLKVLRRLFYRPMTRKSVLPGQVVDLLFPNLEELIRMHEEFLIALKKTASENEVINNIGATCLDRFDGEAGEKLRNAASAFCKGQKAALEQLKQRTRKDAKVSQFMLTQEADQLCRRLKFTDLYASTHQRLVKYPLLFENINKSTPPLHPDHGDVEKCGQRARDILHHVNQAIREAENIARLEELSKKIEDKRQFSDHGASDKTKQSADQNPHDKAKLDEERNLDITKYKLIYEGDLIWRISATQSKELHVVLLDEFLVLLQKQDEKFILKNHSNAAAPTNIQDAKASHSPLKRVVNLLTRNVATDKRAFFLVSTSIVGPQIYDLVAATTTERRIWVKCISDAADAAKSREQLIGRVRPGLSQPESTGAAVVPAVEEAMKESEEESEEEAVPGTLPVVPADQNPGESCYDNVRRASEEASIPATMGSVEVRSRRLYPTLSKERLRELLAELTLKDNEFRRVLEEKTRIVAELRGEEVNTVIMPEGPDGTADARELVLSSILQVNRLSIAARDIMNALKGDDVHTMVRPQDIMSESLSSLNDLLTALLGSISSQADRLTAFHSSMENRKPVSIESSDTACEDRQFRSRDGLPELRVTNGFREGLSHVNSQVDDDEQSDKTAMDAVDLVGLPASDDPDTDHTASNEDGLLLVTSPFKMLRARNSDPNAESSLSRSKPIDRSASFSGFSSTSLADSVQL